MRGPILGTQLFFAPIPTHPPSRRPNTRHNPVPSTSGAAPAPSDGARPYPAVLGDGADVPDLHKPRLIRRGHVRGRCIDLGTGPVPVHATHGNAAHEEQGGVAVGTGAEHMCTTQAPHSARRRGPAMWTTVSVTFRRRWRRRRGWGRSWDCDPPKTHNTTKQSAIILQRSELSKSWVSLYVFAW